MTVYLGPTHCLVCKMKLKGHERAIGLCPSHLELTSYEDRKTLETANCRDFNIAVLYIYCFHPFVVGFGIFKTIALPIWVPIMIGIAGGLIFLLAHYILTRVIKIDQENIDRIVNSIKEKESD